jgi:hypothetical protein
MIMRRLLVIAVAALALACSEDENPIDCNTVGPSIHLDVVVNASSCSTNNGSIAVSVSGGKEPYLFQVNSLPVTNNGHFENLAAGSYSVVVTDANNCSSSVDNIIILADDFSFNTVLIPNTSCSSGNGTVTIEVDQANPPYKYKLGNGSFAAGSTFEGLATGPHVITVEDNNNCMVTLQITVPKGFTGTSWATDVRPILEKNCAISGCHNGVSRANDFSKFASAKQYAKDIKSMTQDRTMPFEGALTQTEINLIACWVDDGAVQN